ncbi:hypothetical protein A0H81_07209 [Grifola frondosa]|uniref:Fe2OG dioxygenase domain-containing protein n=1 Tax=Grifola frondosa TaxID=5627 RepID=A0A1C7M7W5_GRIFR|nr:hypothetical protein A0H81_07209 [Grifola frondosa]
MHASARSNARSHDREWHGVAHRVLKGSIPKPLVLSCAARTAHNPPWLHDLRNQPRRQLKATSRRKRAPSPDPATDSDPIESETRAAKPPPPKKPRKNAKHSAQPNPDARRRGVRRDESHGARHNPGSTPRGFKDCQYWRLSDQGPSSACRHRPNSEKDPEDCNGDDELEGEDKEKWILNTGLMKKLEAISERHCRPVASGEFKKPFKLTITRPGCKSETSIKPGEKSTRNGPVGKLLQTWYTNATVSGYGDVREQVTKVDKNVRNAREIPATEFAVPQELVEQIQKCWDEHFFPNTGVRVEPYKIHLYGPGGHFKMHRDTPEKDLVGTFLVGLGDTTTYHDEDDGIKVDGQHMKANRGSWCAFYPDVPHSVAKIRGGHRAVIAFKLFRARSGQETTMSKEVRQSIKELVDQMQPPFGILLSGKYCIGTTEFSGFDALLLGCASKREDTDVHHLPVILESQAEWGSYSEDDPEEDYEESCESSVYPFTEGHIDALLDGKEHTHVDHPDGYAWLENVKDVPFYSADFHRSTVLYQDRTDETCNYLGNEAQAWSKHSIYLSYALLVLPKGATSKKKK